MGALNAAAETEIEAPIERVWEIVADVEGWPEWQATITEIDVEERDAANRPSLCEVVFDAKVQTIRTVQRVHYASPHRLSFKQERGSLKALAGSWQLEDLGDGRTKATYALNVEISGMLGMLVTGAVHDKLRERLVTALPGELKARAERSS
jgi:ribosome-associated toxin RatA of RatAB toxin-antitoxin module